MGTKGRRGLMAACRPLKEYGIAGGGSGKQGVPVYYGKQRGRGYVDAPQGRPS